MSVAEWRALTPHDWQLVVEAHNEANAGDTVKPPTFEEFEELKAKYGH